LIRATLDHRSWLVGLGATVVALLVLGIPTAAIPNLSWRESIGRRMHDAATGLS
jgi:hypothetical protein